MPWAVMMIIDGSKGSRGTAAISSMPSIPSMRRSVRITSGRRRSTRTSASFPEEAVWVS